MEDLWTSHGLMHSFTTEFRPSRPDWPWYTGVRSPARSRSLSLRNLLGHSYCPPFSRAFLRADRIRPPAPHREPRKQEQQRCWTQSEPRTSTHLHVGMELRMAAK